LEKLPAQPATDPIWRLVFCLRLSSLLHRSRDDEGLPVFFVRQSGAGFQIELPADWLAANPLSTAALAEESLLWQRAGSALKIKRRSTSYSPE
jgi:exopolyphosphatase/guanosine-5'-triphosphate,3'-diphosphate pyrophosphatase